MAPVITASSAAIGSLLVTATILQAAALHAPGAPAVTATGTILRLGGQRTLGSARREPAVPGAGGVDKTVAAHWLAAPLLSVTVSVTVVGPAGYGPGGVCTRVMGSPSGSKEPASTAAFARHAETVTLRQRAIGARFLHNPAPAAVKMVCTSDWLSARGNIPTSSISP